MFLNSGSGKVIKLKKICAMATKVREPNDLGKQSHLGKYAGVYEIWF